MLAQRQRGVERVIAYASRSLHPAERNASNYSSFKIELLAMKWAMAEKFKDYLYLLVGVVEAPGSRLEGVPLSWGWDPNRWTTLQEKDESLGKINAYLRRGFVPGARERQVQTLVVKQNLGGFGAVEEAYNNSVHSTTGYAPAFLMFGRHMRLPVDLLLGTGPTEGARSTTEWVGRHHQQLHYAYRRVTDHLNAAAAKNKRLYDRTARDAPLLPGERVLVRDNRRQGKGKLSDRWESTPYVVERQQGPDMPVYTVWPEGRIGPERVLHRNLLRPCPNFPEWREEAPAAPLVIEAPPVGWAVVPRDPEVGTGGVAPPSPPRRSQRDTRGRPPERYGAWAEDPRF